MKLTIKREPEVSPVHPEHEHHIVFKRGDPRLHPAGARASAIRRHRTVYISAPVKVLLLIVIFVAGILLHLQRVHGLAQQLEAQALFAARFRVTKAMARIRRADTKTQELAVRTAPWLQEGSNAVLAVVGGSATLKPERPSAPSGEEVPGSAAAPPPAAAAAAPQAETLAPIEVALAALKQHCARLSAYAQQAGDRLNEATRIAAEADPKTESLDVSANENVLAVLASTAESAQEEVQPEYEGAVARIGEIRRLESQFKDEAARVAEQARLKREQEDLLARETAAVEEVKNAVAPLLWQHQYAQAISNVTIALASLKTEEGRSALRIRLDRFRWMQELKDFLIASIRKEPYPWGWGSGASARDVLGVDESGFNLRGGRATWAQLDSAQMLRFLRFYLDPKKVNRELRGRMNLAAAVYFSEAGKAADANTLLQAALASDGRLREESERLLASP